MITSEFFILIDCLVAIEIGKELVKMQTFNFKDMKITWLDSTSAYSDGGATFGPVPKVVWSMKYPNNENNLINMVQDPILIQYQGKNYLIDTGFQTNKFSEKEIRNSGIVGETQLATSLEEVGLTPADIDVVLMTHMHNDHASGLTTKVGDDYESTFLNAEVYINDIEWDNVRHPNRRTRGTYLKENWEPIQDQVKVFKDFIEIVPGIEMHHTGGHSAGQSIILLRLDDEVVIHISDLALTSASFNPAWVSGYDDYPMDTIKAKEKWLEEAYENRYRFIFYHDPYYCMVQLDQDGKTLLDSLERTKKPLIEWPEDMPKPFN